VIAANPVKRLDEFNAPPSDEPLAADFVASHAASTSGSGRYQFWSVALDAFGDHPVGGIGAGGYETYWNEHASIPRAAGNPHSLFLQALSELGLLGLGLVLAFFAAIAVAALRRLAAIERRAELAAAAAIVGAGLLSAAIDWTWQLPVVFAPVVIGGALLTGSALRERGIERRSRQALGLATLGFAWLAICAAVILMFSEARLESSRDAAADGDLAAASDDAKQAAALEPWSAGPRLQLALVDELQGDLPVARERIEQAIDRSPDDWQLWLIRARIETKLGDVDSATGSLAQARSLNPRSPLFQQLGAQ
jgi:tetratricopeptide (TPR) repeat protein